jgi:hypothetical protein
VALHSCPAPAVNVTGVIHSACRREMGNGLIKRAREYMGTQRGAAWFRAPVR